MGPSAISLHIHISVRKFLTDFLGDSVQQAEHNIAILVSRCCSNGQVFISLAIHMDICHECCAQNAELCVSDILIQDLHRLFAERVIILACGHHALLLERVDHLVLFCFCFSIAAAATGGEHHHSHHTCQQQGYEFFQVLHKGIPPISLFVDMFLFSRKAFATIVAFLP